MALSRNLTNLDTDTALSTAIDNSQTAIVVNAYANLPAVPFALSIGDEVVEVTAKTSGALTVTRAFGGTAATEHTILEVVHAVLIAEDVEEVEARLVTAEADIVTVGADLDTAEASLVIAEADIDALEAAGGGGVEPFTLKRSETRYHFIPWAGEDYTTSGSLASQTIVMYPIVAPFDCDINALAVYVSAYSSGGPADLNLLLYSANADGTPNAILESEVVSVSTSGFKEATLSSARSVTAGTVLWAAIHRPNNALSMNMASLRSNAGETTGGYDLGHDSGWGIKTIAMLDSAVSTPPAAPDLADFAQSTTLYPLYIKVA